MPYNPDAKTKAERQANIMEEVVVSVKKPQQKTGQPSKKGRPAPIWMQHEHAPWCEECDVIHAYFEGYGPMQDDCTILVPNPTDPNGSKHRVMVQLADVSPVPEAPQA